MAQSQTTLELDNTSGVSLGSPAEKRTLSATIKTSTRNRKCTYACSYNYIRCVFTSCFIGSDAESSDEDVVRD